MSCSSASTTGVSPDPILTIGGKWLELLKEAVPRLASVSFSTPICYPGRASISTQSRSAAAQYSVKAMRIVVHNSAEIAPAIDAFATEPDGGIIVVPPAASHNFWRNNCSEFHGVAVDAI
jgi:hypothetical protein